MINSPYVGEVDSLRVAPPTSTQRLLVVRHYGCRTLENYHTITCVIDGDENSDLRKARYNGSIVMNESWLMNE